MKMIAILSSAVIGALLATAAIYFFSPNKGGKSAQSQAVNNEGQPVLTQEWDKVFKKKR